MKKLLSIVLALSVIVSMIAGFNINAYASTSIYCESGTLGDYETADGSFTIKRKMKVKISLESTYGVYFSIFDDSDYTDIIDVGDVKSYSKTLTLEKGTYSYFLMYFSDPNNNFDDTYYELNVDDVSTYATSIKLKTTSKTTSVGSSFTIKYSTTPSNSYAKITWSSSNKKVATVNSEGKVTAKGLGTCKISAELSNGKKYTFKVTVNSKKLYIFKNSERTLPKINGSKTLTWKSNNKSYATVNKQKVKGKKAGKTYVSCKYSNVTYKCYIYVVDYNDMLNDSKAALKDRLIDPDSLKIYHIWRGYDVDGEPTITLDYGAKNGYGAYVRDEYFNYYRYYDSKNKKFKSNHYFSEYRPKLTGEKKLK